jgi:hypothetical protein
MVELSEQWEVLAKLYIYSHLNYQWMKVLRESNVRCIIGWVNIGTSTRLPLACFIFYVKVSKTAKKSFLVK